jgi:uncharacterized protein (TIGR02172 family)
VISVHSLGDPIALGRTAALYDWDADQVLKLFFEPFGEGAARYESRIAHIVHRAGLPVPAVGEIVEIDGRYGLVYEKVRGRSMMEHLGARPWTLFQAARELARLQAEMHGVVAIPELPSQHRRLREKIEEAVSLDATLRTAALAALASLPPGDRLCHGDFHPGNVLFTADGPVIIDWIDAARGSPDADLARSLLLMDLAPLPPGTPARMVTAALRGAFRRVYLRRYSELCPTDRSTLERWSAVNAAARLSEGVQEERALLDIVIKAFGCAGTSGVGASPS